MMKQNQIDGWTRTSQSSPSGKGKLCIWHPRGDEKWQAIGLAYRTGHLDGLHRVDSAKTSIVHRGHVEHAEGEFYFKQYLDRDALDPIKNLFRDSRARRAWQCEQYGRTHAFHAPKTVCLIEEYHLGILVFSALISEAIDNAPPLRNWLKETANEKKRTLIKAFAAEVGQLHANGIYHGDMRFGNMLCRETDEGFHFTWLDNERSRVYPRLPVRKRIHNLMQLNYEPCPITLADRMRFWKAYLAHSNVDSRDEKDIMRGVIRKTQKRWKKRGWL